MIDNIHKVFKASLLTFSQYFDITHKKYYNLEPWKYTRQLLPFPFIPDISVSSTSSISGTGHHFVLQVDSFLMNFRPTVSNPWLTQQMFVSWMLLVPGIGDAVRLVGEILFSLPHWCTSFYVS